MGYARVMEFSFVAAMVEVGANVHFSYRRRLDFVWYLHCLISYELCVQPLVDKYHVGAQNTMVLHTTDSVLNLTNFHVAMALRGESKGGTPWNTTSVRFFQ